MGLRRNPVADLNELLDPLSSGNLKNHQASLNGLTRPAPSLVNSQHSQSDWSSFGSQQNSQLFRPTNSQPRQKAESLPDASAIRPRTARNESELHKLVEQQREKYKKDEQMSHIEAKLDAVLKRLDVLDQHLQQSEKRTLASQESLKNDLETSLTHVHTRLHRDVKEAYRRLRVQMHNSHIRSDEINSIQTDVVSLFGEWTEKIEKISKAEEEVPVRSAPPPVRPTLESKEGKEPAKRRNHETKDSRSAKRAKGPTLADVMSESVFEFEA